MLRDRARGEQLGFQEEEPNGRKGGDQAREKAESGSIAAIVVCSARIVISELSTFNVAR